MSKALSVDLRPLSNDGRGYDISLLTADTQDQSSKAGWKRSGSLRWKSSSGPITLKVSNYSRADGLSSAHLHGWDGVADWPKTSRKPSLPLKRGSTSQISASLREGSQKPDIVAFIMIQALRFIVLKSVDCDSLGWKGGGRVVRSERLLLSQSCIPFRLTWLTRNGSPRERH